MRRDVEVVVGQVCQTGLVVAGLGQQVLHILALGCLAASPFSLCQPIYLREITTSSSSSFLWIRCASRAIVSIDKSELFTSFIISGETVVSLVLLDGSGVSGSSVVSSTGACVVVACRVASSG